MVETEFIDIPPFVWTQADEKVNSMRFNKISHAPSAYYYIYKPSGSLPPVNGDLAGATVAFPKENTKLLIEVAEQVDIYFTVTGSSGVLGYEPGQAEEVLIEDRVTPALDFYFQQQKGVTTALTNAVAINDTSMIVDSVVDIIQGDYIGVFSGVSGEDRFYFATVLNVIANQVFLDTPFDFAFEAGDPVISTSRNLNVDGSGAPQIFRVAAGGPGTDISIDITRIMIAMETNNEPQFPNFGDIVGGLTNGLVLRRVDGITRNIWNLKTNKEIANLTFDYTPYDASNPGIGVNGLASRYTFAGQDKHGVAVRLKQGDSLEIIIQDNLLTLLDFQIIAQGHQVQ